MRQRLLYRDEKRMAYAANFAAELAEILYEVDITHRELSLQVGVAQATVDSWTRIENPKIPSERNLQRVSELLEELKPSAGTRLRGAAGQTLPGGQHGTRSPLLATVGHDETPRANGATVEVEEQRLAQPAMAAAYPNNLLPSLTQFVGRAQEILEVRQLLKKFRLLSLVGTGGIGKTRLALEVAHGLDCYPDGVWLVELDALQDAELIPAAIAQALPTMQQPGTLSSESLAAQIGEKRLLLLLDNCEHLVAACAQLAETLLRTSPNIARSAIKPRDPWLPRRDGVAGTGPFDTAISGIAAKLKVTCMMRRRSFVKLPNRSRGSYSWRVPVKGTPPLS